MFNGNLAILITYLLLNVKGCMQYYVKSGSFIQCRFLYQEGEKNSILLFFLPLSMRQGHLLRIYKIMESKPIEAA